MSLLLLLLLLLGLLHLEGFLSRDDDAFEGAEPARETFLVRCAEAVDRPVLGNDLEAEILGFRDRVDFGGVDDLGHGDDFDGAVFLNEWVSRAVLRDVIGGAYPVVFI